jgi:hypothetical protein
MTGFLSKRVNTDRLREISLAIASGNRSELSMRVPAEPDRDADLVIMAAADEIDRLRRDTTPAQTPMRKGELKRIFIQCDKDPERFARAIEAHHGIKKDTGLL